MEDFGAKAVWCTSLLFFFLFSSLLFEPQKSRILGLFYWAVSRHWTKRVGHFYPGGSGIWFKTCKLVWCKSVSRENDRAVAGFSFRGGCFVGVAHFALMNFALTFAGFNLG